jgi:trimethylamine--corrinoid protein Co-methyltransferase
MLSSFNALSFEKFVMDDELITLVSTLEHGVATTAEDLAVEVIDAVGPAGHFLAHTHTRRHARDHQRQSFFARETFERWCAPGGPDIRAAAANHVARLLEAYQPPDDLDATVRRQLDDYCLR